MIETEAKLNVCSSVCSSNERIKGCVNLNSYAWLGLGIIVVFSLLQLLVKENRTKEKRREPLITVGIVIGIVVMVMVFNMAYLNALLLGLIVYLLLDKKTYTKKRLIIYGSLVLVIAISAFALFRDNPNYVVKHLAENRATSSLYVVENDVELIDYEATIVRPLASTVKIIIASEYAMQINDGQLESDEIISIDELNKHYLKGTDGGAHEEWLSHLDSEGAITLHDVAKGMVTYSSNANTDYLINLLGADKINDRIKALGLTGHEDVYPIVGALLIPTHLKNESEELSKAALTKKLEEMPMDMYRSLAIEISEALTVGSSAYNEELTSSKEQQRVWSDRLPGATAQDYGKLVWAISNEQFPAKASEVLRDLMEWPMTFNEQNKERFAHLGMKGGSTLFVLTDAVYAETLEGDQTEIVLLTDNLSFLKGFLLRHNLNSFVSNLIGNEEFQQEVQAELDG